METTDSIEWYQRKERKEQLIKQGKKWRFYENNGKPSVKKYREKIKELAEICELNEQRFIGPYIIRNGKGEPIFEAKSYKGERIVMGKERIYKRNNAVRDLVKDYNELIKRDFNKKTNYENILKKESVIREIEQEVRYRVGMAGYEEVKEHFEGMVKYF